MNPILLPEAAGGHLMLCSPFNRLIALDPATGSERWVYDPEIRIGGYATEDDPEGLRSPSFANCRGVAYWEDERAEANYRSTLLLLCLLRRLCGAACHAR